MFNFYSYTPNMPSHALPVIQRWSLLFVPLLALIAYATVLRIGFLSDDLVLLYQAQQSGIDPGLFVPAPRWYIYRPLGIMLVWQVGYQLWGLNPLPYHIVGLLLHAALSSVLALWLHAVTRARGLALLAGALFAVFPLHTEAVGWIAAHWDAWATLFVLLSLWLFTKWWSDEKRRPTLYVLSLVSYASALFTKESTIAFLPIFAISAWLTTPTQSSNKIQNPKPKIQNSIALLPFLGVLLLNVSIRLLAWGHLGGYAREKADFGSLSSVFWDHLISYARTLLSPVNPALLGQATSQVVGAITTLALLAGLVRYGPAIRPLLLTSAAWMLLAFLPVLSISIVTEDLQQNRILYLPAAGYCIGVASLLYAALQDARRLRSPALIATGALLLAGVATCWIHLRPWHTATVQIAALENTLIRLIPTHHIGASEVWYAQDTPDTFRGAYVLRLGLGMTRYFATGKRSSVQPVPDALQAPIATDEHDAFAVRFTFDDSETRFNVDYLSGITGSAPPPSPSEAGESLQVWDFRHCPPDALAAWQVAQAEARCNPGEGLALNPTSEDPMLVHDAVNLNVASNAVRFVRLRVSSTYPASALDHGHHFSEWFWKDLDTDYSGSRVAGVPLKPDGNPHIYWTFIPAAYAGGTIAGLRFDPINGQIPTTIHWIALDLVR